jgi:fructose-1,6-bisphosphatase/inositol monophosphatase family enzyme
MREVAAAAILPRFRNLAAHEITQKERPSDVVTVADVEAEHRLTGALGRLLPGSRVVGEEAVAADAAVLDALAGSAPVWLVDPVDGTQNFSEGSDCFAVIVAYCEAGETLAGWILDPVEDVLVFAGRGEGAWIEAGGRHRRLAVAPLPAAAAMAGSLDRRSARRLRSQPLFAASANPPRFLRYGSVGREYMHLGQGILHFAHYVRLKPWDHAAGVLIHAEAGGFSRLRVSGRPYRPKPYTFDTALLLAPDETTWTAIDAALA